MEHTKKISLFTAILMNINIIIGSAYFLGAGGILKKSGALSPITWIIWGFIMLPIVLILAKFTKIYPLAGGLYVYANKVLGSFWGFISGWSFFIGTIAGNSIIIYAFAQGISKLGLKPLLAKVGLTDLSLAMLLVLVFTLLNFANVNFLDKANKTFAILKSIPLFFVIIAAFFLFNVDNVISAPVNFSGFFESIPFIIFAYVGFECCCSITHQIKNGKKNASKAILLSFISIMIIYTVLQLSILGIFGQNSINPFLEILPKLTSNPLFINWGNGILQITILSSFLGGFYGMFYANNWILFAIAQEKSLPFSKHLTTLNKYQMPWVSVIVQAILTLTFLFITQNKYYLITMSDFAIVTSYLLITMAFVILFMKNKAYKNVMLGMTGSFSAIIFLYFCFDELMKSGIKHIFPFFIILGIGITLRSFVRK